MPKDVNSTGYTMTFAVIICLVCSVMLSGLNVGLSSKIKENFRLDQQKNVLLAAGLANKESTSEEISAFFSGESPLIKTVIVEDSTGRDLSSEIKLEAFLKKPKDFEGKSLVYEYAEEGKKQIVILPIRGKGLWGPIVGFLALSDDSNTIAGMSWYKHIETPGLGAEIETPWFTKQFVGKKILKTPGDFSPDNLIGVTVLKGKAKPEALHQVDGISGATITSKGVTKVMTQDIKKYLPYIKRKAS